MDKFETYVITSGSWDNITEGVVLANYRGFIYYLVGPGGVPGTWNSSSFGGGSGFVNTGYFDLEYPYNAGSLNVYINTGGSTYLSLDIASGSPADGTPIEIYADSGNIYIYTDNVSPSTDERSLNGAYGPGNNTTLNNFYNQRLDNISNLTPQGGVTSDFSQNIGATGFGGGGFYGGVGSTGPYGYGSGSAVDSIPGTRGYAVLTFIPKTMVETVYFNGSSAATGNIGATGLYIYNMTGGGGGGGGGAYSSTYGCFAGGGGGSAEQRYGFALFGPSDTYKVAPPGAGGAGGDHADAAPGESGGTGMMGSIVCQGGQGGYGASITSPGYSASGGYGWYGGGRGFGSGINQYDGTARTYLPSNFPINGSNSRSSDGGGFVYIDYGQGHIVTGESYSNAGGGGGGWYGGNGAWNVAGIGNYADPTVALGYGGGGGGGAQSEGSELNGNATGGSVGFIYYSKFYDTPNLDYHHIVLNNPPPDNTTTFNFFQFKDYKGVWFFLSGDKYVNTPFDNNVCVNTGHFLIQEDNVRTITITKDTAGYYSIKITFSILNGKTQTFTMKATTPQPYMDLLFYKG
jgi:hypothetical protein